MTSQTVTIERSKLELALEALEDMHIVDFPLEDLCNWNKAITAIKEALAQPEQEPVAWGFQNSAITGSNRWMMLREEIPTNDQYGGALWTPLYTTPPQRKPLTDEQIFVIKHNWITTPFVNHLDFARAIEAAHGIKE